MKAAGADATVQTDNVEAGRLSCAFLADRIGHKGNVIIENGPQVSAVIDRVTGCRKALAQDAGIKILSADQDGKGSRDGGLALMQGYLIRYPDLAGVFTINDPQAVGSDLAIRQLHRKGIVITSVDGAPDIVGALKDRRARSSRRRARIRTRWARSACVSGWICWPARSPRSRWCR